MQLSGKRLCECITFDEIIEKYKRFIYKKCIEYRNIDEFDELYQLALIGLWKAYENYIINDKTKFISYAGLIIKNEILMHSRKIDRHKNTVSMEYPIFTNKDGSEITVQDLVGENDDFTNQIAEREILKKLIKRLKKQRLKELSTIFDKSITQNDLAKKSSFSQSYVSRRVKETLSTLKKWYLMELNK